MQAIDNMKISKELKDFFLEGYKMYVPNVYIDCVIFGYHDQQLKILLAKNGFVKEWRLPGGYIKRGETLQQAADRTIIERTGIKNLYLQQFRAFGDPNRNRYKDFDEQQWFELTGFKLKKENWLLDQTVSIGFYAITDFLKSVLSPDPESIECAWFDLEGLPTLGFDHNEIVSDALKVMKMQIYHMPIGYNMLPEMFTLAEIHSLYEALLGKKVDVSNFAKKLIVLGILEKTSEKRKTSGHRSPLLFKFNEEKYVAALKEGVTFM